MSVIAEDIQAHWSIVRPLFSIRNENEYDLAIERLNTLIDEIGDNEQHPLYELLDTLGVVIHAYEEKHHSMPKCSGVEMLQFLMEEHQLETSDFPEIGTPDIISEILDGERELTVKHLQALAARFHVSPAVFV
ncbi:transcriptional regulator [Candidatus Poribacteria bacterium]|nr:transcriptional regulator [Candidatus Poribacteria bacterium]